MLEWAAVYLDIALLSVCRCCIQHACLALWLRPGVSVCQSPNLVQILSDHCSPCSLITFLASYICLVTDLPDGVQTAKVVETSSCLQPSNEGLYVS